MPDEWGFKAILSLYISETRDFAPLKDPKDTFGFTIGALSYVREFAERGKLPKIIDTLSIAGMSKEFGMSYGDELQ